MRGSLMARQRRVPGEGSIFQLPNGRWRAQVSIGPRGHRRYRTRTATSRTEARRALAELQDELHDDGMRLSRQSLGDFLRSWLDETARHSISPNTYRGYDDVIAHMNAIAHVGLRDLSAEDLEHTFNRMTVRRGKVALPASDKTIRNAQVMMRRALGMATDRGLMRRNVALQVPLRKVERAEREAMTPALARSVLARFAATDTRRRLPSRSSDFAKARCSGSRGRTSI